MEAQEYKNLKSGNQRATGQCSVQLSSRQEASEKAIVWCQFVYSKTGSGMHVQDHDAACLDAAVQAILHFVVVSLV
jgi:hypothetical protein